MLLVRSTTEGEALCDPIKERKKNIVFAQNNISFFIFLGQLKLQHPAISKTSFNSALTCLACARTGKDLGRHY